MNIHPVENSQHQQDCGKGTLTCLASGVDDVTVELDALVVDALGESAFDGGIVRVHEVVIDELHDQGGFS